MISVVVPVMNEEGNLKSLITEIGTASTRAPITEIIYVDDGSTDHTYDILKGLTSEFPMLRVLHHDRRSGQSTALLTGIRSARNEIIVTLDGDGQNDPADIPLVFGLYKSETQNGQKIMVTGRRKKRNDSFGRRVASRFANRLRAYLLKDNTQDTGCSLKLFTRTDYLNLPFFNHMHRFLPALMVRDGVQLAHVDVSHRHRMTGISKYTNFNRALVGIADLMGVMWLQRRPNGLPIVSEYQNERTP